jgi:hypothetical protein
MNARAMLLPLAALAGCAPTLPSTTAGSGAALASGLNPVARCRVAASQQSPLVTEWPASEKANLEALLREGGVAVAYSGCSLRVLPQCRVRGSYRWRRTTPATDNLEITSEDDLYAHLPVGAASLEGELARSGRLAVQTTVSGQLELQADGPPSLPADGPCAQATHVMGALAIGAFTLTSGASTSARAEAGLGAAQVRAKADRSASLLRSAGNPAVCGQGTEEGPHPDCASPIQVFLWPLPGRVADEGPPGAVKVDFVSANPAARWDVYAEDEVICSTPCARWVNPTHPILLRTRDSGLLGPSDRVRVANLLGHPAQPHLQLRAHATSGGEMVTGITFTSLSGMAAVSGIALTAVGCGGAHSGMCKGGLITLGAGVAALAGSVWLILDASAHADVLPEDPEGMRLARAARRRWVWAPGLVAGTF